MQARKSEMEKQNLLIIKIVFLALLYFAATPAYASPKDISLPTVKLKEAARSSSEVYPPLTEPKLIPEDQRMQYRELFNAVLREDEVQIVELISQGLDPDRYLSKSHQYGSPMSFAVKYAKLNSVRVMLEWGADPNGWKAGAWVSQHPSSLLDASLGPLRLKYLSKEKDHPKSKELAAQRHQNLKQIALLLLRYGADPNYRVGKSTVLLPAILSNDAEIVKAMLNSGAKVPKGDTKLISLMIRTVHDADAKIVELLVRSGADPNAIVGPMISFRSKLKLSEQLVQTIHLFFTHPGITSLSRARMIEFVGRKEAFELMRELIKETNQLKDGESIRARVLYEAVNNQSFSVVKYLLEIKVDPCARLPINPNTAYEVAAYLKDKTMLKLLTKYIPYECQKVDEILP